MPPSDWNPVPLAAWYIMQERKFILAFLGPLCVFASALFFTHFLSDPNYQDLGDAIRNTATSTLSLLYTFGLLIWGYVVNRKRAWEYEGGTFGFGVMSISLALIGTAANFVEVREDRLKWLPWLVNTVLLWQSWAGFWWWVGAGMWTGEVQDIEQREARKKRREERRQRKRLKMSNLLSHLSQSSRELALSTALSTHHTNDPPSTALDRHPSRLRSSTPVRPNPSIACRRSIRLGSSHPYQSGDTVAQIELDVLSSPSNQPTDDDHPSPTHQIRSPITETSSSTNDTTQPTDRGFLSFIHPPGFLQRWVGTLSAAHNEAAKQQARANRASKELGRFGLRAMTQRVASQQKHASSKPHSPTHRSHLATHSTRSHHSHSTLQRRGSGSDAWVSEAEVVDENHSSSTSHRLGPDAHLIQQAQVVIDRDRLVNSSSRPSNPSITISYQPEGEDSRPTGGRLLEGPSSSPITLRPDDRPAHLLPRPHDHLDQVHRQNHRPNDSPERHSEANSSSSPNPIDQHHHRNWKRPLIKARLKDVTIYD